MNECCDWHAVCLNDTGNEKEDSKYLSYCPECNSVSICEDIYVTKLEGDKKDFYMNKYKDKINSIRHQ